MIKFYYFFFSFLISFPLIAQDQISVYFDFGSSEINPKSERTLLDLQINFNLSELDSIHYIGVTDSVGSAEANKKLSLKRAKKVAKFCKGLLPKNTTIKIIAQGEGKNTSAKSNRRVNLILFFKKDQIEEITTHQDSTIVINKDTVIPKCYTIDYKFLAKCNVQFITKRKKQYALLRYPEGYSPDENLYYGYWLNEQFQTKKIKQKNGSFLIPKNSFLKYQVFKISSLPCGNCNEDFQNKNYKLSNDTSIQVDYYLMSILEVKRSFFRKKLIGARVPKEFVDLSAKYFYGCDFTIPIEWKEKKGRRNKKYYFLKLKKLRSKNHNSVGIHPYFLQNITKIQNRCNQEYMKSYCDHPIFWFHLCMPSYQGFSFVGEVGAHFQNKKLLPYTALGIEKEAQWNSTKLLLGSYHQLGSFYGAIRHTQYLMNFPIASLNPFNRWQIENKQHIGSRFIRSYIGAEFKTRIGNQTLDFRELNIHWGLKNYSKASVYMATNYFLQFGLGYDFLRNNSVLPYGIIQISIETRFNY